MFQLDLENPIRVHFIGIGGISMSGLAMLLLARGFSVSGSDAGESELTARLRELGATIFIGQAAENISKDIDLVVYTAAIRPDNPELASASSLGLPLLTRADLLGQVMHNYATPIAIAGTHGKTTATSMAAHVLLAAGADPTISVGGMLPAIGGNFHIGTDDTILVEACEYQNSFLSFAPRFGVILNIEADHLDFFKDLADIRRSFRRFAESIPADGALVIQADIDGLAELVAGLPCRVITYASASPADVTATDIAYDDAGCASFSVTAEGSPLGRFCLRVPGEHNVENALAVIALGQALGLSAASMQEGLAAFDGTDRRFQKKGDFAGVTVIDDYAHHPTEIRATLCAARRVAAGKLWCIFQPHTYTRTKALLTDFADALALADEVILADIYAAREQDIYGISSRDLQREVAARGTTAHYFPSFAEIEAFARNACRSGDLLLTMGAGNIVAVGEHLLTEGNIHHD